MTPTTPPTPLPTPQSATPETDSVVEWVRPMGNDSGPPNEQYVAAEFAMAQELTIAKLRSDLATATAALARSEERNATWEADLSREQDLIKKLLHDDAYEGGVAWWIKKHDDVLLREGQALATIAALTDKLARSERELAEAKSELAVKPRLNSPDYFQDMMRFAARAESAAADLAKATAALATAREQLNRKPDFMECATEVLHVIENMGPAIKADEVAAIMASHLSVQLAAATARCGELEELVAEGPEPVLSLEAKGIVDNMAADASEELLELSLERFHSAVRPYLTLIEAYEYKLASIRAATIAKASAAGGLAGEGTS